MSHTPSPQQEKKPAPFSREDVQQLLNKKEGPAGRVNISYKLSCSYARGDLAANENHLAEQVFRLLVNDKEIEVRAVIAEQLKQSSSLPRDIAFSLATDKEDVVALPILQYSEVLSDDDIVKALDMNDAINRQVAVSTRKVVSTVIVRCLLTRGKREVMLSLVKNENADFKDDQLEKVLAGFSQDSQVMAALGKRENISPSLANKAQMTAISTNGESTTSLNLPDESGLLELPFEDIHALDFGSDSISFGPKDATVKPQPLAEPLKLIHFATTKHATEKLVNQMIAMQQLDEDVAVMALGKGYILFFEMALSKLAGVPIGSVQTLANDRGELGLRALCNEAGFSPERFASLRLLLRVVRQISAIDHTPPGQAFADEVASQLLLLSRKSPVDHLEKLLALLRYHP